MTQRIKATDLPDFDMAEHLKTNEDVANYLTLVQEENDPAEMTRAPEKIHQASATKRSFAGCAEEHAH